jgi:hypothetical protein
VAIGLKDPLIETGAAMFRMVEAADALIDVVREVQLFSQCRCPDCLKINDMLRRYDALARATLDTPKTL